MKKFFFLLLVGKEVLNNPLPDELKALVGFLLRFCGIGTNAMGGDTPPPF
jgi:hypothetical protein